jgi:hypothetical protein
MVISSSLLKVTYPRQNLTTIEVHVTSMVLRVPKINFFGPKSKILCIFFYFLILVGATKSYVPFCFYLLIHPVEVIIPCLCLSIDVFLLLKGRVGVRAVRGKGRVYIRNQQRIVISNLMKIGIRRNTSTTFASSFDCSHDFKFNIDVAIEKNTPNNTMQSHANQTANVKSFNHKNN